jgi:chromate transporter
VPKLPFWKWSRPAIQTDRSESRAGAEPNVSAALQFPIVIIMAALTGFVGARLGVRAFLIGGGHGAAGPNEGADADTVLGEATPEHARPNLLWSLSVSLVLLALWWARCWRAPSGLG